MAVAIGKGQRSASEGRHHGGNQEKTNRQSGGQKSRARFPIAPGNDEIDAHRRRRQRQFFFARHRPRQRQHGENGPSPAEPPHRKAQQRHRERHLVEIVERDSQHGRIDEVGIHRHQTRAVTQAGTGKQIDRPSRQCQGRALDRQQAFGRRPQAIQGRDQNQQRREMFAEKMALEHAAVPAPAMRQVPEQVNENAQIGPVRFQRGMFPNGQGRQDDGITNHPDSGRRAPDPSDRRGIRPVGYQNPPQGQPEQQDGHRRAETGEREVQRRLEQNAHGRPGRRQQIGAIPESEQIQRPSCG